MAEGDRREDIAAAMEKLEPKEVANPEPAAEVKADTPIASETQETLPGIGETAEQTLARRRDEEGKYAKEPKKAKEAAKVEAAPEAKPAEAAPVTPKYKAPSKWGPTIKETWDKLPPEVQQQIVKRDRETERALNESSEARQYAQRHRELVAPYEPIFRGLGVDTDRGIQIALQSMAQLAQGPQQTKAQVVAEIIKTYGVDIPTLDSLLAGQPIPQQAQNPQQFRDPRLDQLLAQVDQQRQASQSEVMEEARSAIEEVENEEFFPDVRNIMADLIESNGAQGIALSARDAYNRAVWAHPETARVMEQRRAAAQNTVAKSVAAASSVKTNPASGAAVNGTKTLREDISAAWNERVERSR